MWPDRVSNLVPLTYESGALPTALRGLAKVPECPDIDCGSSKDTDQTSQMLNPIALRKTKIAYNFGLSECSRVKPGPEVIQLFLCPTQLSMKFFLLINVKMPTIVGILTFMSRKNSI